ncbi:MAG TPA: hypothetical protein VNO33_01300, partial [Kofleriaceae bacterium]|nr:hypothetical protein [Kofleriaceae bacterium]
ARGVAAAADRYGVIALWTDRVLWVSRDDGRSFHQELAAPEPITAAAVGPDGRVYAARHGGRLGVLSPDGVTRWLDISADQLLAIDAGIEMPAPAESPGVAPTAAPAPAAPWLAVLGLHADSADGLTPILWLSGDHGRSWRRLIAPHHGDASNQIRVGPTGVIDLVTVDGDSSAAAGASGRLRHYTGHVDGRPFALRFASDEPPPLALGHDGHGWRLEWDGRRMRLIDGSSHLPLAVRNWDVRVAASREHTYSVADGRLVELGAGRPRPVTHSVPGAIDALAVDGLGRALALVGDTAVRYSKRHGWRRLFEIPPP